MSPDAADHRVEGLLRELAPQVLGAVVRRYGHFDTAEDAVQEALIAAAAQWPRDGLPDRPRAWLITVAGRRLTDLLRAEQARRLREDTVATWTLPEDRLEPGADRAADAADDTLVLLFLCCHPALPPEGQIALTLRTVGGLSTEEIARAFMVPVATMGQRISRAKARIKASGVPFRMPPPDSVRGDPRQADRGARLAAVLHVLYLVFTEGYARTSGPELYGTELSAEAIRLARIVRRLLPDDAEVAGLLALMLLTDARRPARSGPDGALISMDEQDRTLWDAAAIEEGVALVSEVLPRKRPGPYQIQAAIAAVHDEAGTAADTDWPQIVALYEVLLGMADNPMTRLNHAVAVAMASGPRAGLALVAELADDPRLRDHHRLHSVRAHLLEMSGDRDAAREAYTTAARHTGSRPVQRYLNTRAARLG